MPVAVFCLFLVFWEISTKRRPNATKLFDNFFQDKWDPRRFGRRPEDSRGGDKATGRALGGRPDALWAPHGSFWPNSTSINSLKSGNQQRSPWNTFFATASICSWEIPSGGLFQYSARGGIDHGGALHQPCCPSDDAWAVYHWPLGP